jgi:hypothetical protein
VEGSHEYKYTEQKTADSSQGNGLHLGVERVLTTSHSKTVMCNKLKLQTKKEPCFVSDWLHFRLSRQPRKISLISIMWKVVIKRILYKQVFFFLEVG